MGQLSIRDYLDYLRASRPISQLTIRNYEYNARRLGIDYVNSDDLPGLWASLSIFLNRDAENKEFNRSRLHKDPGFQAVNPKRPHYYGYVRQFYQFARDMLNHNSIKVEPCKELDTLVESLSSKKHVPVAYADEQVKLLLSASLRVGVEYGLYRLLLLLLYSGIRISAAEPVRFSSFRPVAGVEKVLTFKVSGPGTKGHCYNAIISRNAVERMQLFNPYDSDYISNHRPDTSRTSFSNYNRSQLAYAIISAGIAERVTHNTSILNSLRKTFSVKLARFGVQDDAVGQLMGQIPKSLAYKVYEARPADGTMNDDIAARLAKVYSDCGMADWEIWS